MNLVKVVDGKEVGANQSTTLEALMTDWRVHKGKMTEPLPGIVLIIITCFSFQIEFASAAAAQHLMQMLGLMHATGWVESEAESLVSKALLIDCAKGALVIAMQKAFSAHADSIALLDFMQQPFMVKTKQAIAKGVLKLPCCSTGNKVVYKNPAKTAKATASTVDAKVVCKDGTVVEFTIASCINPPLDSKGEKSTSAFVCPFWFITKKDTGDMVLQHEEIKVDDFVCHIPVAINSKRINKAELLTMVVNDDPAVAPPAKKAKH